MKMTKKNKGFTLVELLAVLLVLAILAVITIPIVVGIISKSRQSTYQRNIETYGKAVEDAVDEYIMDHPEDESKIYTSTEDVITISKLKEEEILDLKGVEVDCGNKFSFNSETHRVTFKKNSCRVNGTKTVYGYKNGKIKKISSDEIDPYEMGEKVIYNGISFRVIENSDDNQNYITLLKEVPLTVNELNEYGKDIINKFKSKQAYYDNINSNLSVGLMAYYNNSDCGYVNYIPNSDGCSASYDKSDVKKVVEKWALEKIKSSDLVVDKTGYKYRLITYNELIDNLEYSIDNSKTSYMKGVEPPKKYNWILGQYTYWTMTPYQDYDNSVWFISKDHLISIEVNQQGVIGAVRPVINLKKSAIK